MRINSILDVKCFCNNKNVLRAQSMVLNFGRHPVEVCIYIYIYMYEYLYLFTSYSLLWNIVVFRRK